MIITIMIYNYDYYNYDLFVQTSKVNNKKKILNLN